MKITFEIPKEVTVVQELRKTIEEVTIDVVVDDYSKKEVRAYTKELGTIILWKDAAYDTIGQWTDADVIQRITELYV
jgi:hypothetical protein